MAGIAIGPFKNLMLMRTDLLRLACVGISTSAILVLVIIVEFLLEVTVSQPSDTTFAPLRLFIGPPDKLRLVCLPDERHNSTLRCPARPCTGREIV